MLVLHFKGIVNSLLTTPLWVANTRLKLQGVKRRNESDEKHTHHRGLLGEFLFIHSSNQISNFSIPAYLFLLLKAISKSAWPTIFQNQ